MSYDLNSLKIFHRGVYKGALTGDTRSLDKSSNVSWGGRSSRREGARSDVFVGQGPL